MKEYLFELRRRQGDELILMGLLLEETTVDAYNRAWNSSANYLRLAYNFRIYAAENALDDEYYIQIYERTKRGF